MAIEWLAGNRIRGTSTERTSTSGFNQVDAVSGSWVEVGRTTLGSPATSINVTSLPNKRYYKVLVSCLNGSGTNHDIAIRFNSDSGSNYANRDSQNGASDGANGNRTEIQATASQDEEFTCFYVANKSDKEKLVIGHSVSRPGAGAGNAPQRREYASKWVNTSDSIDEINIVNTGAVHTWAAGSEVVVLGYDPADTHTTNFWEQLADVTLSSAGDNISSGTFSAKKYLWIQTYISDTGGQDSVNMTFNNDTGNNYAFRRNNNGGTDATTTSTSHITLNSSEVTEDLFSNIFIINNSSNEKLVIGHTIQNQTLGAGTAPIRKEFVGKWTNTSSQITEIDFDNDSSGSYDTNSIIRVWGAN